MDISTPASSTHQPPMGHSAGMCEHCHKENPPENKFCLSCGFPLQGTEQEQESFKADIEVRKIELEEAEKNVKSVRNWLYALAGLNVVYSIFTYFSEPNTPLLIVNAVLTITYAGLGYWSKNKPFAATLTAMIIYGTLILLNAFLDPLTLVQGFIFKGLFIAALIKGIRSSLEAEKIRKKFSINE